ncbi:MAG: hypothetical protein RL637_38 [Pseudomonadota bacterium]|jgi:methenyltetrahydromethanopterin cyclohydrolase
MLAQATRNIDCIPLVIDCYADQDTQDLAYAYWRVSNFAWTHLSPLIQFIKCSYQPRYLIYGSGFEQHLNSLHYLANNFEIIGNSALIYQHLNKSPRLFQQLDQCNITYPEIRWALPKTDLSQWLIKPIYSSGGIGIRYANSQFALNQSIYYQRYIRGDNLSVLFIANGQQAKIIGINRQFITKLDSTRPFIFSGIINNICLPIQQQQLLMLWINQLTAVYRLSGLNSLDFILSNHRCYFLELNPRISASMQLYDADLLRLHLQAYYGKLTNIDKINLHKMYQIFYAPQSCMIPKQMNWPENCVDIPVAETLINRGQPLCSVIVSATTIKQIYLQIRRIKQRLFQQLYCS